MVLVKNVPEDNRQHFEPEVSWVEIMPEKDMYCVSRRRLGVGLLLEIMGIG